MLEGLTYLSVQQLETLCQIDVLTFEMQNRKGEIHEKLWKLQCI